MNARAHLADMLTKLANVKDVLRSTEVSAVHGELEVLRSNVDFGVGETEQMEETVRRLLDEEVEYETG